MVQYFYACNFCHALVLGNDREEHYKHDSEIQIILGLGFRPVQFDDSQMHKYFREISIPSDDVANGAR